MNQPVRSCFKFGEFLLDGPERRLLRNGVDVPLAPKVLDTLLLLAENHGHLLTKDELMKQLWPDTFVGEEALSRNISVLRKALGESNDSQSYIATVSKRGYRFVAPVERIDGSAAVESVPLNEPIGSRPTNEEPSPRMWRPRFGFIAVALAAGCLAGLITFHLLVPPPVPKVLRSTQITHSGRVDPYGGIQTDGTRVYYIEREGDHWNLMQNSVRGGESQNIAAPFRNTMVLDVSPDHANLLIGTFTARGEPMPVWIWPVQGGALKRVGDITAFGASWCPNGHQIIYSREDGVYMANADGTEVRQFVSTAGQPWKPLWSPDGRSLRFSLQQGDEVTMWEVRSDGSQLHRLLPAWNENKPMEERAGGWTRDGKYFVFATTHAGRWDIWAVRNAGNVFRLRPPQPTRLSVGPMAYAYVAASDDGRRLFVIAGGGGGELVRYDPKSHQPTSLLAGLCDYPVFSPDGTSVICASPDGSLVRMRPDGGERLVLSSSLRQPYNAKWSPDGKEIAVDATTANGDRRMFLVSSQGGTLRELFPDTKDQRDVAWSPDGKLIAFSCEETPGTESTSFSIQILDLFTNRVSMLPGSSGMRAPAWSPDGRFIAAATADVHKVMLFDRQSGQWTQLAQTTALDGRLAWAKDGKSLYYQDLLAVNESVYRIWITDHKKEVAASFESLLRSGVQRVFFYGFDPGGALLVSLDRNIADIYALDIDLP